MSLFCGSTLYSYDALLSIQSIDIFGFIRVLESHGFDHLDSRPGVMEFCSEVMNFDFVIFEAIIADRPLTLDCPRFMQIKHNKL